MSAKKHLPRRDFIKCLGVGASAAALWGKTSFATARESSEEQKSPVYFALNMSKVVNSEESFQLMKKVGPKVCITTAAHPGFVGFQANYQTGILPDKAHMKRSSVSIHSFRAPIRSPVIPPNFFLQWIRNRVAVSHPAANNRRP